MKINYNDIFDYRDGKLYWKVSPSRGTNIGAEAGASSNGYLQLKYKGKQYYTHRVIYEMHYGEIPEGLHIDHINRVRDDNRIENLRLVTHQENSFNTKAKGCSLHKPSGKYQARITVGGTQIYLGLYTTEEEARAAYKRAKEIYHKEIYDGRFIRSRY